MRLWVAWFLLLLSTNVLAATVGAFSEINGDVRIQRGDALYAAAQGVAVDENDIIETGDGASTQIEMKDGSVLRLGANSHLLVADYELDDAGNVLSAGLEVLSGWLRFAVAKLHGSAAHYAIATPTMTVGIRGTEGVIEAESESGGLYLEKGLVAAHADNAGSVPVNAGEYIERARGRAFAHPRTMPAAFRERMPHELRAFLVRHPQWLRRPGMAPRWIRRLSPQDRQNYLREHPHMREQLEERFRTHGQITPQQRAAWRERHQPQQNPNRRRERLRHRPHPIPPSGQP
jgi:hypothetical protein